jgi:nucleoid DNA-binding protein
LGIVEGFLNTVIQALSDGKGIEIRGFGSYKVKKKRARNARNPRTGEKVYVGEHFVPVFKFSKDFKDAVDKGMKKSVETEQA